METKLNQEIMLKVRDKLELKQGIAVECEGKSGGLALLWDKNLKVAVNSYSHYKKTAK